MAKMVPSHLSLKIGSKAEGKVFHALQNSLNDSHTIFHSFDILARNLQNKFIDAEIDFLIFHHKDGLLTLEVKGGNIGFNGEQWIQNGKPLTKSPYQQAKKNKYAVSNYLQKKLGKVPPITFGHAVCFPDVFTEMTDLPAEAHPAITITGNLISHLESIIPTIFNSFKKDLHKQLTSKESEAVRKVMIPEFEYGTSLVDMMGIAEQQLFRLTEET